jgi:uncharacterized membrane protein YtjA (UPF0391 family)
MHTRHWWKRPCSRNKVLPETFPPAEWSVVTKDLLVRRRLWSTCSNKEFSEVNDIMASWVWILLVIALVAAVLGFGGVFAAAAGLLKVIFWIAIVLFVIGLLMGRRAV